MRFRRRTTLIKSIVLLAATAAVAVSCMQQPRAPVAITASETPAALPVRATDNTFRAFSHSIPEHKKFECSSCHRREGASLELEYAGHDSCVGCHISQFTNQDEQAMCAICHQANPPAMATFPARFIEGFNMKFDHADHVSGAGRPPEGCASC